MATVAQLIPAAQRRLLLENNHIALAQGVESCNHTKVLVVIWKEYVEPTFTVGCGACYQRVIRNYRALQDEFIKLELESKLLDDY